MVDLLEFPMLLDGFSAEERRNIQVYLSENEENYRKIDDDLVEVTSDGIQIYYREILKKGQNYQICAVYEKGSTGIYSFPIMMRLLSMNTGMSEIFRTERKRSS